MMCMFRSSAVFAGLCAENIVLAYDYHGPWDTNVTGQAPVTNPHTSILDMRDSVLLYVRAGIDMSKGSTVPLCFVVLMDII